MLEEGGLDAIDHAVRLGPAERRREVLHDDGIGVERGERLPGVRSPCPQEQALGPQLQVGRQRSERTRATSMSKAGTFIPPWGTITSA